MPPVQLQHLTDGSELVAHLQQASMVPSLVLLDLNMPGQDSFKTLRELRSLSPYQDLPVVVLTTSCHEQDREKSLELDAIGFLTKPTRQAEAVAMLQKLAAEWWLDSAHSTSRLDYLNRFDIHLQESLTYLGQTR